MDLGSVLEPELVTKMEICESCVLVTCTLEIYSRAEMKNQFRCILHLQLNIINCSYICELASSLALQTMHQRVHQVN